MPPNLLCQLYRKIGQTLLIGSANGLWVYKNPEEAEPIKFENSVISKGNIVNDITDDGKGGAWLCSDEFLIHLNLKDRSLKKYKISKDLLTGNLRNICRGGDRIYIGTRNSGLLVFDPSTASTEPYIDLDCPVIADLNSDGKDLLYVATDGNGAYIIDTRKRQIVNTYRTNTADFPLPSNAVYTFGTTRRSASVGSDLPPTASVTTTTVIRFSKSIVTKTSTPTGCPYAVSVSTTATKP